MATKDGEESPGIDFTQTLPETLIVKIFSKGDIADLLRFCQVSKGWNQKSQVSSLWRLLGEPFKDDYLQGAWTEQNAQKTVRVHFLRMYANTLDAPEKVEEFVEKYPEILHAFRASYALFIDTLIIPHIPNYIRNTPLECWIEKGNAAAMNQKMKNLVPWDQPNLPAAKAFNARLSFERSRV